MEHHVPAARSQTPKRSHKIIPLVTLNTPKKNFVSSFGTEVGRKRKGDELQKQRKLTRPQKKLPTLKHNHLSLYSPLIFHNM